jgi:hypothetical protein
VSTLHNDWIAEHLFLFIALIVLGIVAFQALLLNLIAAVSGWKALAVRFRMQQPFSGQQWKWQSAQMRYYIGYNNCLVVGADQAGLFLRTMWIVRTGHAPLFTPWNEITLGQTQTSWLVGNIVTLTLGRSEQIPFRIRASLAVRLKSAAGASWPAPSQAQIPIARP